MSKRILTTTTALVLCAGAGFAGPDAMTPAEARHLVARTGFGASPADVAAMTGKSYAEGVAQILAGVSPSSSTPMPGWTTAPAYPSEEIWALGDTMGELFITNRFLEIEELSQWWLGEMIATPSPLTEKLTLFWHDHFATSFDEIENAQWMADQNRLFRQHAAGNFADLANAMLRDPALLTYLSNTENVAQAPNENLGREFLELFTLGQGRGYTETDVKEVARALTGHGVDDFGTAGYAFWSEDHDPGTKTILGQSGRFDASDLTQVIMQNSNFGPYIIEKMWKIFVSDVPDPQEVTRLATLWRDAEFEIKPLLEALFLSDAFWDPANRGRIVKGPVELLVGTARSLGMDQVPLGLAAWATADMGQTLFFPPNVAGWPTGTLWITDASAIARATMMAEMMDAIEDPDQADDAPRSMAMMTDMAAQRVQPTTAKGDLRVGQVFGIEAEYFDQDNHSEGHAVVLSLFDVSFGSATYRSLPLFMEREGGEDGVAIGWYTGGCAPGCLFGIDLEEDAEGWAYVYLEPGEEVDGLSKTSAQFVQAISQAMPALLTATKGQPIWTPDPEREDPSYVVPGFDRLDQTARDLARTSKANQGPWDGQLISAFSRANALGLGGQSAASQAELERYLDALEEDGPNLIGAAAVTYSSLDDWVAALPTADSPKQAAQTVLLAVPYSSALPDDDISALLRQLILSPEYQVN